MGLLDIPRYDKTMGIVALILSIVLGGIGVLIMGIIQKTKDTIILGVILILLSFVFGLGWILAVVWGVLVLIKAL